MALSHGDHRDAIEPRADLLGRAKSGPCSDEANNVQLYLGEPLDQTVDERAFAEPLEAGHLPMRENQMGCPMRACDLLEPAHNIGGLDPNDIRAEIHRIVEGFLDVPRSIERLELEFGRDAASSTAASSSSPHPVAQHEIAPERNREDRGDQEDL